MLNNNNKKATANKILFKKNITKWQVAWLVHYLQTFLTWLHLNPLITFNRIATIYLKYVYLSFCMEIGNDVNSVYKCFRFFPILLLRKFTFCDHLRKVFSNNKYIYSDKAVEYSILTQNWMSKQALTEHRRYIHPKRFIASYSSNPFALVVKNAWITNKSKWFMNKIQILYGNTNCQTKDQNLKRKWKIRLILIDFMMWINASASTFFFNSHSNTIDMNIVDFELKTHKRSHHPTFNM